MDSICSKFSKNFKDLPIKVLQFGEGNFLRAFADWYIQKADEKGVFNSKVVMAQPTPHGRADFLNSQDCFYTVALMGRENGQVVESYDRISCVSHCINTFDDYKSLVEIAVSSDLQVVISNTTEAGIAYNESDKFEDVPDVTYPGKLTALLYERFKKNGSGLLILPVELIENNGDVLKKYVLQYASLWQLGDDFCDYINNECKFCSTLVDRIVTGFPKNDYDKITQKLGYDDKLITVCEPYNSWIIQGNPQWAELFPIHKAGLNITWCDDITPYRTRKVRILNGAHTMSVLAGYLAGFDIVRDMMQDELFSRYINKGLAQVKKTIDLPEKELDAFAAAVLDRFDNPFIDHRLLDISLNSVSKFKARCLPSLLDYVKLTGELPSVICFGLSALIAFYNGTYDGEIFVGHRDGNDYIIKDSKEVTDYFDKAYKTDDVVKAVLENKDFWDIDLTEIDGLYDTVKSYFDSINSLGMKEAVRRAVCGE
ncbi:MAG: tagaturonate reductase [Eubacteriales bacterium]|nr:tagaturonate reductase [Eubacteriales bacterium]